MTGKPGRCALPHHTRHLCRERNVPTQRHALAQDRLSYQHRDCDSGTSGPDVRLPRPRRCSGCVWWHGWWTRHPVRLSERRVHLVQCMLTIRVGCIRSLTILQRGELLNPGQGNCQGHIAGGSTTCPKDLTGKDGTLTNHQYAFACRYTLSTPPFFPSIVCTWDEVGSP